MSAYKRRIENAGRVECRLQAPMYFTTVGPVDGTRRAACRRRETASHGHRACSAAMRDGGCSVSHPIQPALGAAPFDQLPPRRFSGAGIDGSDKRHKRLPRSPAKNACSLLAQMPSRTFAPAARRPRRPASARCRTAAAAPDRRTAEHAVMPGAGGDRQRLAAPFIEQAPTASVRSCRNARWFRAAAAAGP